MKQCLRPAVVLRKLSGTVFLTLRILALLVTFGGMNASGSFGFDSSWVKKIPAYPVGQTDPFSDELHRLQSCKLYSYEQEIIRRDFPGWPAEPTLLADWFPRCYQSLQLKFDPYEYEERGGFLCEKDFEPHPVRPDSVYGNNRTYSLHLDRYADPRYEGKYNGAILLIPGTGSYGGNYVKFAMTMASLKGYIVYVLDLIGHGRSHGHKIITKVIGGEGTGVHLDRAVGEDRNWHFDRALEPGWREKEACKFHVNKFMAVITAIGRRIAHHEAGNLAHLNDRIHVLPADVRDENWFGKPINRLTHVTLIGTSQGGEIAFWGGDPRAVGKGQEGAYGILYPFDSIICHDVYNSAYTAPKRKMRLLRSGVTGGLARRILGDRDSLWELADWTRFYEKEGLFLRAADRWVRWRYDIETYRGLLRFGIDFRGTLPHMKIPVLVAIGKGDKLYTNDSYAHKLVKNLFDKMERENAAETLYYLEYQTPEGQNGHQLLVHHTFPFADLVDAWIRYRRGGPGSPFEYNPELWKRIR